MNDLKTIVMKFEGPLQSYGTSSHFEIRHTDPYPSKSAILGMIAAAMGIRREETGQLADLDALRIAVRVDQIGHMYGDYHIAAKRKGKENFERDAKKNYVTRRYYLEDAIFLVAVEGEDGLVDQSYEALKNPYFQLFYGRRSCPVNYDFLQGIYTGSAIEQLHQLPWMAAEWYQRRMRQEEIRLDIYADQACLPNNRQKSLRRDEPKSFSQLGRQHDFRFEVHENFVVKNPYWISQREIFETEHDAFAALSEE